MQRLQLMNKQETPISYEVGFHIYKTHYKDVHNITIGGAVLLKNKLCWCGRTMAMLCVECDEPLLLYAVGLSGLCQCVYGHG